MKTPWWFALALSGCINQDTTLFEVQLRGEVVADDEADGAIVVEIHHLSRGEGVLEHPLGLVHSFTEPGPGRIGDSWWHPIDEGEGVVVFAWQDRDGDGVLCTPDNRDEPVGVAVFDDVAHALVVDITLDARCLGPERLVP